MRIEIRSSSDDVCASCGSHELIFVPSINTSLERELLEHFAQDTPWWSFIKRRRHRYFTEEINRVVEDLRSLTSKV